MRGRPIPPPVRRSLAALLLALSAAFPGILAQEIPRRPDRSVTDLAGILRPEEREALEALNREVLEKSGVAIVVLTVPDLGGHPIEDYANRLGREWGIGSRATDRGILFLVSVGDRKVRIETGYGIEGYLPDGLAGEILDEQVLPNFRRGDLSAGVVAGNRRIAALTAREFGFTLAESGPDDAGAGRPGRTRGGGILGGALGLLLLILFLAFAVRHPILAMLLFSGMGRGRGGFRGGGFGAGGFGGGGFGGFGGGSFGGGGASRGW